MDAPEHWGTSTLERARRSPADDLVPGPVARWTRAATSSASPGQLWRWLTQVMMRRQLTRLAALAAGSPDWGP